MEDATAFLVEGLNRELPRLSSKLKEFIDSVGTVQVAGTGISRDRNHALQPMTVLAQALERLWAASREDATCVVILLDDVGDIRPAREFLSLLQQALISLAPDARLLTVLSSTVEDWRQIAGTDGHTPLGRYFTASFLKELSDIDVVEVIRGTLDGTGVTFSDRLVSRIQEFAAGSLFTLQLICRNLYDAQIRGSVSEAAWSRAKMAAQNAREWDEIQGTVRDGG